MKNPFRIFFRGLGRVLVGILRFAESRGLTDDLVDLALRLVTHAQVQFLDNDARRAYVIDELHRRTRVPESVARLVLELAVHAYKRRVLGQ